MAIDIAQDFQTERYKYKNLPGGGGGGLRLYPDAQYLIIRLPDSKGLTLIARLFLLALVIISLPWIGSIIERSFITSQQAVSEAEVGSDLIINLQLLPLLFRDLTNEGFLKVGEKAVFLSNGNEEAIYRSLNLSDYKMDLISVKDLERQSSVQIQTLDFTLASNFPASAEFIDRTLKIGGIVIVELSENPSVAFHKPLNYKIVYLRRFKSANIIAMKKTGIAELNSTMKRRLCGHASEAKKAALKNLEDVLLEPPRSASRKSNRYLKRTRYLPDLMGDSLESYPRHVFIDVGLPEKEEGGGTSWFVTNYPTRNKDFNVYKIETVTEESSGKEVTQIGMSDWLMTNVKEEEYVVMKAEAEVVEEMVKSKTIRLVDELFLECKPNGHGGGKGNNRSGRRAYWECLALYGRLRDEGIAVHQWWG